LLLDFEKEHKRRYGHSHPAREVELVTLRLRAILKSPSKRITTKHVRADAFVRPRAKRSLTSTLNAPVQFEGKKHETKLYAREDLRPGQKYSGPSIVTEYSATSVIPPGKKFHVDKTSNLIIAI
jgi:N-methylhydantoinase A